MREAKVALVLLMFNLLYFSKTCLLNSLFGFSLFARMPRNRSSVRRKRNSFQQTQAVFPTMEQIRSVLDKTAVGKGEKMPKRWQDEMKKCAALK